VALPVLAIGLLVLIAPFGEGGRAPWTLCLLHLLVFTLAGWALILPRREPIPEEARLPAIAAATVVLLAGLSAWSSGYRLAGLLGWTDMAAALALFMAVLALPRDATAPGLLRGIFLGSTALQALLAIVRLQEGGTMAAGRSFLNPNHLAAYLNAGALVALAAADGAARAAPRRTLRAALPWLLLALLHLAAALPLASRGGLLGLGAGILLLGGRRFRSWTPALRRAAMAATLLVALAGIAALDERFRSAPDPYRFHRLPIWRASFGMLRDGPVLGIGPGLFPHLAPRHNFPAEEGLLRYERSFTGAHSGLLTFLVEQGTAGAAAACAALGILLARLLRGAREGSRLGPAASFAEGVGAALAALLAQGLVEDLQERPALVLIPSLLCAAALAHGGRRDAVAASPPAGGFASPAARTVAAAAIGALLWGGVLAPALGDRAARRARLQGAAGVGEMERAARLVPLHPGYRHDLAMAALNTPPFGVERYADAVRRLKEACRLKPIDHRYPLLLARLMAERAPRLFSAPGTDKEAAALYREAVRLAPLDPGPRLEAAAFLWTRGRPEEGLGLLREALVLEPHYVRARILETRILLDLGRQEEAERSRGLLAVTLERIEGVRPESGYGREILADSPSERRRLEETEGGRPGTGTPPANR
jgi:O-antigen ligase